MARRLFIGLDLPASLKEEIASAVRPWRSLAGRRVRWVRPEKLHFTLKFLGELPEELAADRIAALQEAMREVGAATRPARIRVRSAGVFPSGRRPRVLWLDAEDRAGVLALLARKLDGRLEPLGFERERRAFVPHLTIARLEGEGLPAELLEQWREREFGEFYASELTLFESVLSTGAYAPLGTARLSPVGWDLQPGCLLSDIQEESMEPVRATQMLRNDHKVVRGLFDQAEASGSRAPEMKPGVVGELFMMLEIHSRLEEELFYPALVENPETSLLVAQGFDDHQEMKDLIRDLRARDVWDEGYRNGLAELQASVTTHVETEEKELFPLAERILGDKLDELGHRMLELKQKLLAAPEYQEVRPEVVQDPNGGEQMRKEPGAA